MEVEAFEGSSFPEIAALHDATIDRASGIAVGAVRAQTPER